MTTTDISPMNMDGAGVPKPRLRGFAAMDPQRLRQISGAGGRAAHESGHAHEFTVQEARAAGKKRQATRSDAAGSPARS